ncbi:hypothetical protein Nepgr_030831 [Nepenthes gracilis]|uniref:Uncharacterized protein n=1 Tax=Nepenthes gracilis TaxID=150966 RepID=A0AAD3THB1_NEPGR|nr:hypothetical protein Nepgr_030831 [Nepenthes gracilis]
MSSTLRRSSTPYPLSKNSCSCIPSSPDCDSPPQGSRICSLPMNPSAIMDSPAKDSIDSNLPDREFSYWQVARKVSFQAECSDSVVFDGAPQEALSPSNQCPRNMDSEGFGNCLANSSNFPVGSIPENPGPSIAGGLVADASPLASSSPPRQGIPCPSNVLLAVSSASAILPAPSGAPQLCPEVPRNSPAAALPPGADACNHGVSWSSVVQHNTPGGKSLLKFFPLMLQMLGM